MRLSEPILSYLNEHDAFTWDSRNMPVYGNCGHKEGNLFCVSHKVLLNTKEIEDTHLEHKSNHVLVMYCFKHKLMEQV